ncbi:MAG: hypothetical protein A2Y73_07625 [Chloroflexi bacterium RBG_13_56_8]|nr:MAG: hypothetical protein A2Y73_07625 [Chloroflexi bacterium RBG_13_56_8]
MSGEQSRWRAELDRMRSRLHMHYVILGVAGLIVLVQLVMLAFPRDNRVAMEQATTTPRPTRTATPTATLPPTTNTPSFTPTPLPPTATATPRATSTPAPTKTPEQTPTPTETSTPEGTLGAAYVRDVTIPDYAVIDPGESFAKTWRIKNSGTRNWPAGSRLAFVEGQQMDGETGDPLMEDVAPGEEVDITIPMTAPSQVGTYKGTWQMQTAEGEFFGAKLVVIIRSGSVPAATPVPTAAPVTLLNTVNVENIEGWGTGWIMVKYQDDEDIFVQGSDGHRYRAEMGFLSSPQSLATIQQFWTYGNRGSATWAMFVLVRTEVGWVHCGSSDNVCYQSEVNSGQARLTSQVFYRPNVWSSLLESYLAGGLLATTQNAYYHDIQWSVYDPICGAVPDVATIAFKFTRVD